MGRSAPSALVPLFRSEALARVLAAVLLHDEPLHVSGLASRAQLPYSTTQREVERLERAGILRSTRFAGSRVIRANDAYPYLLEVRALLLKAYGPIEVLGRLVRLPGVTRAYVFGSWAARYLGDWSAAPRDVDVLLVGTPDPRRVDELAASAEAELGQPVQTTVVSPETWETASSGFVRTVKKRPLVELDLGA